MVNINSMLRNALFLMLAVYFSQGALYATGSPIGKLALFAVLFISIYFFFRSVLLLSQKSLIYYSILILVLINVFGFLMKGEFGGIYFSQLRNILTATLPFFACYYLAKKGYLNEKHLMLFFFLMLPLTVLAFYFSRNELISESIATEDNVVSNVAYSFVSLIPFVFFFGKRKVLAIISLMALVFLIIQGAKRGALVTASVGVLVFGLYQFFSVPPGKKIRSYVIAVLGCVCMVFIAFYFFKSNEFLIQRMQSISEGGSGRDSIYSALWTAWLNSDDFLVYLLGFGFVATIDKSGSGFLAHNDWLELLVNFGLLGVLVYFLIFLGIMFYVFSSGIQKKYRLAMLAIAGMWMLQTMFSMYYTSSTTAIVMVALGYLVGSQESRLLNK